MRIREVGYECLTCHKFVREVTIPSIIGFYSAIQCGCGSWKIEEPLGVEVDDE